MKRELMEILELRLLIARAANSDSLGWWDDESLTQHAHFLLERIFPMAPAGAARNLSLRAALARHQSALTANSKVQHLFRLDTDRQDELLLRHQSTLLVDLPDGPIKTVDDLRVHLLSVVQKPPSYTVIRRSPTHGLEIEIPPTPAGIPGLNHRARSLAWAYLEGEPGRPVFPFIIPPAAKELSF